MRRWVFLPAVLLLVVSQAAMSATYYVDFATGSDSNAGTSQEAPWKRAPGMNGFAGNYAHSPGDRFIFKGGVSWDNTIAQWRITNSGTSGSPDYYGVDKAWHTGAEWTRPIFDGGSMNPIPPALRMGYFSVTAGFLHFDNLQLQNIGVPGTNQGNYAIRLLNVHDILVENMALPVMSRIAILITNITGTKLSNFEFRNNDISACVWGIGGGPGEENSVVQNVLIHDNRFHDFHPQLANGSHGDGIYLFTDVRNASNYLDAVYIYNNSFYGDFSKYDVNNPLGGMTAFIWPQSPQGTAYIYNNQIAYSKGGAACDFYVGAGFKGLPVSGSVYIYNNSIYNGGSISLGFLNASGVANLVVENNIVVGNQYAYVLDAYRPVGNFVSDYNDFHDWSKGAGGYFAGVSGKRMTYSQFVGQGYEAHGLSKNPLFVSPVDLHLQPGSPAIRRGINLSPAFTADTASRPRPSTGPWDLGAYQASTGR